MLMGNVLHSLKREALFLSSGSFTFYRVFFSLKRFLSKGATNGVPEAVCVGLQEPINKIFRTSC